ncbi:MAG: hypothetical protein LUQ59_01195, partial [Methanothrix sp.]|nr:hypothetical protein [Methanothrix sp.]
LMGQGFLLHRARGAKVMKGVRFIPSPEGDGSSLPLYPNVISQRPGEVKTHGTKALNTTIDVLSLAKVDDHLFLLHKKKTFASLLITGTQKKGSQGDWYWYGY